ncbi:MAG: tyrosine-type recombinase/integrase [Planctomycetaceae bacterium]|nr:tyrosine-type recombinase/integrase [Planctomycetaceae bacterium]MCB9951680.1 tyrosine-type recombinase/integrase [Planctomycetaceae bacterium]
MPRKFRLTWQPGKDGREGRWRKKYKNKVYYYPGGSGKYDRAAYDAAYAAWESDKSRIDATAPRAHQVSYEEAISEWEQVLAWSNRHGHLDMAAIAYEKLQDLRRKLEAPKLTALRASEWFADQIKFPTIQLPEDLMEQVAADLADGNVQFRTLPNLTPAKAAELAAEIDGSPQRIVEEQWKDRLRQQERRTALQDASLNTHVEEYVRQKEQKVEVGELSAGRAYAIRLHLMYFRDWLGKDTGVAEIDGSTLLKYQTHLLANLKAKGWSRTTAQHYLKSVKAFVRWLWQTEEIPSLPRVLDGKTGPLNITPNPPAIIVYTTDEITQLLKAATDRTKLYILLMLNCGMTQKDISDLKVADVNWEQGRIIRKRSKTSHFETVPKVSYVLWTETFRLLQQERSSVSTERVLTNANGSPICTEQIGEDGKFKKTDNVKNAFERLRKKVGVKKPLKSFKKTSASLLKDEERFQSLEDLFLGHAPKKMSDKHYTEVPGKLLDRGIAWLETLYKIPTSPQSED